jgi:decaprenylphospho-beta-D-erythro-pentofuranosid-2-ulose 2-reductase
MARVFVLGATSAIAAAVAQRMAARGDQLFLVGRNPDKLATVVASLGDAVVGHRALDLAMAEGHDALVAEAEAALGGMDIALVCHGLLGDQLQTETSFAAAREVFEVNLLSAVGLVMALANHFEPKGAGQIAVITSVAGERGRPRNYTYGAAKSGLNTYLEGVRSRLWRAGVTVQILKPGPVDTPMTEGHQRNLLFASADQVADGIIAALNRRSFMTFLPWYWVPIMSLVRRLPEPIFQLFPALSGR